MVCRMLSYSGKQWIFFLTYHGGYFITGIPSNVFLSNGFEVSQKIRIGVGTRQGGLTSPYLFNLFYQDMIEELNNSSGGIRINGVTYNAFGYADDALLVSLTSSGLQNLIDCAVQYVTKFQLSFNPLKTTCLIKGNNPFTRNPCWSINKTELTVKDDLSYLGIKINDKSEKLPVDKLSLAYKVQDFVRMVSVPKLLQSYGERYAILFSHTAVRQ